MKNIVNILLGIAVALAAACSSTDLYDELPKPIANFVSHYYPNTKIDTFTSIPNGYKIVLSNGPGLTFDKQYSWTSINGYGSTIPQVLVFDQFPPDLYDYLQSTDQTDDVFAVMRDSSTYTVELLNNTLYYDIATGEISGKDKPS